MANPGRLYKKLARLSGQAVKAGRKAGRTEMVDDVQAWSGGAEQFEGWSGGAQDVQATA